MTDRRRCAHERWRICVNTPMQFSRAEVGDRVIYRSRRYLKANRWDRRNLRIVHDAVAPVPGEVVLEIGCGRGHLTQALRTEGMDVTGVDVNPHVVGEGVTDGLYAMPAHALRLPDDAYDLVISFHMVEHVQNVDAVLAEMARVTRPGGRLLLVYPAEPVRGTFSVPASVAMFGHPFKARQIHRHTIRPRTLHPKLKAAGFIRPDSLFRLRTTPQFQTVAFRPS